MLVYQRVFINYQKVSKTDPDFELSQKCCYEFKKKHVIPIPSITKSCSNFRWFSQRRVNTNWSATGLMLVASLSPATWSDFKTVDQLPNQFLDRSWMSWRWGAISHVIHDLPIQWPCQEPIDWRYRFHFFQAYLLGINFREYPSKIWPNIWY